VWSGTLLVALTPASMWALLTVPLFLLAARAVRERCPRVVSVVALILATVLAALVVSSIVDVVREARFPAPPFGFGGSAPRVRDCWSFSLGGFQLLNDMVIAMGVHAGGFARACSVSARGRGVVS
jgi:hypothetical protein